jgi:hypothetical protein
MGNEFVTITFGRDICFSSTATEIRGEVEEERSGSHSPQLASSAAWTFATDTQVDQVAKASSMLNVGTSSRSRG